ncbi:MAG: restriction endonuclease, partial [Anaerolineae bacterium]|nr:restriction endonuclease [Anaerolineae bacterium]
IVAMASNKGDVVLDPFCGCGTTIAAAQQLDRRWLGIDITHLAVSLIKNRLYDMFGEDAGFEVVGEPADVGSACALAQQDPYQFEYWALSLVQARPSGADRAKGADRGIDGVLYFRDDPKARDRKVVVQVKSGRVNVGMVRDFAHVIEREKAAAGIFITLEPPTKAMLAEAAGAGFYYSKTLNRDYPRLQILTVEELMAGQTPSLPRHFVTFKAAQRVQPDARTVDMFAAQPFGGDDLDEPIGEDNQIE